MRMQVILDSLFARPGSAPIWGGKKEEFRDWTIFHCTTQKFRAVFVAEMFNDLPPSVFNCYSKFKTLNFFKISFQIVFRS